MKRPQKIISKSCKVVVLGESDVGKTSIIERFLSNNFDYNKHSISGAFLNKKSIILKDSNKQINFEIWDTPGYQKYRILHRSLYEKTDTFLLVYDLTNRSSLEEIKKYWINEIKTKATNKYSILLFF